MSSPPTRLTLLRAIVDGLRWEEFLALYGKLILQWGVREFGLQDSDAEDLRQEVLIRVWVSIRGYDPAKGRFRAWLHACTRNAVCNLRRRRRDEMSIGTSDLTAECPNDSASPTLGLYAPETQTDLADALRIFQDESFTSEHLQAAVKTVQRRVQPQTWNAFLLFEFFEMPAKEVAPLVHLQPAAVNQAVFRVRQLFQKTLRADCTGQVTESTDDPSARRAVATPDCRRAAAR